MNSNSLKRNMKSYAQIKAIEEKNRRRLLVTNNKLNDESGIYILYREENGIRYAYVGQAKRILTRLVQHLSGYQHIDISLKKHGFWNEKENGWKIHFETCPISALDESERVWIKYMADKGYQLRNKTLGGQDEGKSGLDNQKPSKGYYDGLAQGRKSLARELKHIIDTHLEVKVKKENKITQKALEKFWELLKGGNE